jgi:CRP/FNR family transcriptional regulator, nitrogen oxide reductase regulator
MGNNTANGLLEKAELFHGLPHDALAAVFGGATRLPLRQGAELLKQGDPPDRLFMVERGKVKMSVVTPEGAQLVLRFMGDGDIIGCAAVFRGLAYPATATAAEDTTVLAWSASHMNELVARFPGLAVNALRIVGGRADEFLQRLREAATEKVEQRIARALLRLAAAQRAASSTKMEPEIVLAVSRQDVAEFAGATLYTVSRTISAWSRQGIIAGGRGRITIREPQQLAAIAGMAAA